MKLGSEEEEILAGDVLLGEEIWMATLCAIAPGVIYLGLFICDFF
jgi:hypothetical protein